MLLPGLSWYNPFEKIDATQRTETTATPWIVIPLLIQICWKWNHQLQSCLLFPIWFLWVRMALIGLYAWFPVSRSIWKGLKGVDLLKEEGVYYCRQASRRQKYTPDPVSPLPRLPPSFCVCLLWIRMSLSPTPCLPTALIMDYVSKLPIKCCLL